MFEALEGLVGQPVAVGLVARLLADQPLDDALDARLARRLGELAVAARLGLVRDPPAGGGLVQRLQVLH